MDNKPLSKRQRQILALMKMHDGLAAFPGNTREFFHYISDFGLVIKAYQTPEYFLKNRGLIATTQTNAPGQWYRLTAEGECRAKLLK